MTGAAWARSCCKVVRWREQGEAGQLEPQFPQLSTVPGPPTSADPLPQTRRQARACWLPLESEASSLETAAARRGTTGPRTLPVKEGQGQGAGRACCATPVDTQRWPFHAGARLEVAVLQPKPKTMTQDGCRWAHTVGTGVCTQICSGPGDRIPGGGTGTRCVCIFGGVSCAGGRRGDKHRYKRSLAALPVTVGSGCRVAVELGVLALVKGGQKEAGCNHEEDGGQCRGLSAGVQLWV